MDTIRPAPSDPPLLARVARDAALAGQRAVRAGIAEDHPGEAHAMLGHVGSMHIPIDVIAQEAVERYIYRAVEGPVQVIGEEVHRSMWSPIGGLVVTVDPLDGTGPAVDLGFGWATVVLVHQLRRPSRRVHGWRLMGAAIASCSGDVAWWIGPRQVMLTDAASGQTRRARVRPERTSGAVATVGAKPRARARFVEHLGDLDRTAYTLGGTPTAWGLLSGRLAASLVPAPAKQWDAAHVLLASSAGAVVTDWASGRRVDPATVTGWFSRPAFPDGTGASEVPSCVVAVDAAASDSVRPTARAGVVPMPDRPVAGLVS